MSLAPIWNNALVSGSQDKQEKLSFARLSIVLRQPQVLNFTPCKMASEDLLPRKLWEHQNPRSTQMWKFLQSTETVAGLTLPVRSNRADVKSLD